MIDRRELQTIANQTGFQIDVIEKAYRLTALLERISKENGLKNLAIKGGTALNFIYLNSARLSVDIDFNYAGSHEKEKMLEERKYIKTILEKIFKQQNYAVTAKERYSLRQDYLNYTNSAGNKDNVKLEINYSERVPVTKTARKNFKHFFNLAKFKVNTYALEELMATKIRALTERATPRDLYDTYTFLTSKIKYDKKLLKKMFIFYSSLSEDARKITTKPIDEINEKNIKKKLLPLLRKKQEFDLKKAKEKAIKFVNQLLNLTKQEKKFIELLYDRKQFKPSILFEKMKTKANLDKHPIGLWKIMKNQ